MFISSAIDYCWFFILLISYSTKDRFLLVLIVHIPDCYIDNIVSFSLIIYLFFLFYVHDLIVKLAPENEDGKYA